MKKVLSVAILSLFGVISIKGMDNPNNFVQSGNAGIHYVQGIRIIAFVAATLPGQNLRQSAQAPAQPVAQHALMSAKALKKLSKKHQPKATKLPKKQQRMFGQPNR